MLINLRNALMAGKRLPYDSEVEFLESTGTQWIDTGITPDTLDLSVELTLLSKGGHVFGCRNSSNLVSGNIWSAYSNNATSMREDWLLSSSTFAISSTVPNTVTFSSTTNGSSISYGGQTYTGNAKTTYSYSMVLFGVSTAGVVSTGKMVIYACKIWKNGTLVRDYIPVRKGTVGYLYDRVSGKLFGNAGTGDFVLGQDVVPVEWLESPNSNTYIDTGVKFTQDFSYEVSCRIPTNNTYICGARASASSQNVMCVLNGDNLLSVDFGDYLETRLAIDPFSTPADCIIKNGKSFRSVNSTEVTTAYTGSFTSTYSFYLFAVNNFSWNNVVGGALRVNYCKFWDGSNLINNYIPVRVGTEGAMMDVLTRRIYRNAGTGAFGYGNDLKYPIPSE